MCYFATLALLACIALLPSKTSGQTKITSITIGSGESAVVSGLAGVITLSDSNDSSYGEVAVMQQAAWGVYGVQFSGRVNGFAAISAGHIFGVPWAGPYLAASTSLGPLTVGGYAWPSWLAHSPDGMESKLKGGHLAGASVSYSYITLGYTLNKFLDNPWNELPSVTVSVPLSEHMKFSTSATHNGNAKRWMYYLGMTFVP